MAIATRDICIAGNVIDISLKILPDQKKDKRKAKTNPTPEDVWEINKKNAEKTLARILNANFIPGDWHLVFTYAGEEPSQDQAKKNRTKLCNDLTAVGIKWVAVTEYKHERIHHHIVAQYMPFEFFAKLWPYGDVRPSRLKRHRNYRKLANYLIKETSKTYREKGSAYKRRWSCSKNIIRPEVNREEIRVSDIYAEPKPFKGYYIDPESVRRFDNPITGTPHLEYTMIALDDQPRIKKWYKGTTVLREQNYNYLLRSGKLTEQLEFDISC